MTNPPPHNPTPDTDAQSSTFIGDDVLEKSRDPFSKQVQIDQPDNSRKGFRSAKLAPTPQPSQETQPNPTEKPAPFSRLTSQNQPNKTDHTFKKYQNPQPNTPTHHSFSKIHQPQPDPKNHEETPTNLQESTPHTTNNNTKKHLFRKSEQTNPEPKIQTVTAKKTFHAQLETPHLSRKIAAKKRNESFNLELEQPIAREKIPLTKREKSFITTSLFLTLIILLAGYWKLHQSYYKPIPYPEIASTPITFNGSQIDSYQTFWNKPTDDQNVKINTNIIPHVVLKTSQANCAYRILFYDSFGKIIGDPVTLSSHNRTLDFPCTSGFPNREIFFGYQTGSFQPWKFEVWQAKDINSENYQKVFQAQISTTFQE